MLWSISIIYYHPRVYLISFVPALWLFSVMLKTCLVINLVFMASDAATVLTNEKKNLQFGLKTSDESC